MHTASAILRTLFAALLLPGAAAAALGLQLHRDDHAARDWKPVRATIVGLEVRSPAPRGTGSEGADLERSGNPARHIPLVVYEWQSEGRRFRSSRYRLSGALARAATREDAWQALAGYRVGASLVAYRHPRQAERAVLDRTGSWRGALLTAAGAVTLAAALLGLLGAQPLARALGRAAASA
jgi:hypothetical protein